MLGDWAASASSMSVEALCVALIMCSSSPRWVWGVAIVFPLTNPERFVRYWMEAACSKNVSSKDDFVASAFESEAIEIRAASASVLDSFSV